MGRSKAVEAREREEARGRNGWYKYPDGHYGYNYDVWEYEEGEEKHPADIGHVNGYEEWEEDKEHMGIQWEEEDFYDDKHGAYTVRVMTTAEKERKLRQKYEDLIKEETLYGDDRVQDKYYYAKLSDFYEPSIGRPNKFTKAGSYTIPMVTAGPAKPKSVPDDLWEEYKNWFVKNWGVERMTQKDKRTEAYLADIRAGKLGNKRPSIRFIYTTLGSTGIVLLLGIIAGLVNAR